MRPTTRFLASAAALLSLLAAVPAHADEHDPQAWGNVTWQGPVAGKVLLWAEVQGRFGDNVSRLSQSLVRPGVGYQVSRDVSVWAGYGRVDSHSAAGHTGENRLWQQLSWNGVRVLGGTFSTRSRLEQRMMEGGSDTGWRVRQFLKFNRPFQPGGDLSLVLTSETFVALNDTDWGARPGFDQARNFAGVGFSVLPKARMEVGYLNQYIDRPGANDRMNHIASVSLLGRF